MSDYDIIQAELANRELARRRYRSYLPYVHGGAWVRTRLSEFLADRVQSFIEKNTGNAYDILVIETPPQHGKSLTITESLPSWYLGKYPTRKVILASYNDDFAERFCRRNNRNAADGRYGCGWHEQCVRARGSCASERYGEGEQGRGHDDGYADC